MTATTVLISSELAGDFIRLLAQSFNSSRVCMAAEWSGVCGRLWEQNRVEVVVSVLPVPPPQEHQSFGLLHGADLQSAMGIIKTANNSIQFNENQCYVHKVT